MAMAIMAGTGPPPSTKISTSAMTISGTARMMSIRRRNSGVTRGHSVSPRVESSDSTRPAAAPISVETAAMLIVSISAGKNLTIRAGRSARFSQASDRTSAG
jgi:hypothetical protein